jgi:quercetin dioxygenase-like cupin family protein
MSTMTLKSLKKSFTKPDSTRTFNNGKIEFVTVDDVTLARITLKPGWRWSKDVRPIAETGTCQSPHIQYVISGRLMVAMDDRTKIELKPGDFAHIAPGHDAYVVGSETFVAVDLTGMKDYAVRR